jgi:signal transduction histidine kinase
VLIVLMVAVFVAIILLIVRQNTTTLRNNLITESRSFAALATQPIGNAYETYSQSGTIRIEQEIDNFTDLDHDINQVEIIDTNGNQVFTNNALTPIKVNLNDAVAVNPTYLHNTSGNLTAIVQPYIEGYGIHRYDIVYGISYQSVNKSIASIVTSIIALSTGILLLSLLAWYFLINRLFLQPIAKVSHIALQISQGNLDAQMHLKRSDEIGDLAIAVDTMANSLKADIAKLKETDRLKSEFLMIIAHNLRTPLAIIAGLIDNLRISKNPEKDLHTSLEEISTNVTRLGHFAEDALTISSMEEGQTAVERQPLEMAPIIQSVADEFVSLAKQKKLHFTVKNTGSAWVKVSKPYFHSALRNLLDNAYKFTAEGGTIELEAVVTDKELSVTVRDSGIGIAADEVPKLFTKFHRATDTEVYNYEGTGIGLYLTKLIIEQHDGTISVETTEGKGSAFTMHLPTVPTPVKQETNESK